MKQAAKPYYGPQRVGGIYKCAYWRYEYKVLAIGEEITCEITSNAGCGNLKDEPNFAVGHIWSHRTGWDYGRDKIISE